jgi:hypothetical protein
MIQLTNLLLLSTMVKTLLNFGKALFKALAVSRPDQPAIATVSYYLDRINNGQRYYAMEGRVDKKADTDFNPPYITNGVNGNVMNATKCYARLL